MSLLVKLTASELDTVAGGFAAVAGGLDAVGQATTSLSTIQLSPIGLASATVNGSSVATISTGGALPSSNVAALSGTLTVITSS
jgi:BRCT domain type II-containing protein